MVGVANNNSAHVPARVIDYLSLVFTILNDGTPSLPTIAFHSRSSPFLGSDLFNICPVSTNRDGLGTRCNGV